MSNLSFIGNDEVDEMKQECEFNFLGDCRGPVVEVEILVEEISYNKSFICEAHRPEIKEIEIVKEEK